MCLPLAASALSLSSAVVGAALVGAGARASDKGPSWKETFERAAAVVRAEYDLTHRFGPPATDAALANLERHLSAAIPPDLRAMLAEFDGIAIRDRSWGPDWRPLYFSVEEMLRDVPEYLTTSGNPMPPLEEVERVAFFAHQNGFAELYAVCTRPFGGFRAGEVLRLSHETGEFSRVEASLRAFVGSPRYAEL